MTITPHSHEGAPTCTRGCAPGLDRRRALQAGGVVLATGSLVACGSPQTDDLASDPGAGDGATGSTGAAGDALRFPLADTPVGGSTFYADAKIIVSQPTEGEVVVFDSTCTHSGCMVSETGADGTLVCPCHGSTFAGDTGEVLQGPAAQPLATRSAQVEGSDVVISG